jgi:hypothetical protein
MTEIRRLLSAAVGKATIQVGFSTNVGNVRHTDHSTEQTPSAGMAEERALVIAVKRQLPDQLPVVREPGLWVLPVPFSPTTGPDTNPWQIHGPNGERDKT